MNESVTLQQKRIKNLLENIIYAYSGDDDLYYMNLYDDIGLNAIVDVIQKISISQKGLVTFYTRSPGLLIGIRGELFEKLTKTIKKELEDNTITFSIQETKLFEYC